jgi:GNAT superfamily N-acetyltransferase
MTDSKKPVADEGAHSGPLFVPGVEVREYTPDDFEGVRLLYRDAGWAEGYKSSRLKRAWEQSHTALVALHGDVHCGCVRTLSDGEWAMYLADMIVLRDYRKLGVGRLLVNEVGKRYPYKQFHHQALLCKPRVGGFYESCGWSPASAYDTVAYVWEEEE